MSRSLLKHLRLLFAAFFLCVGIPCLLLTAYVGLKRATFLKEAQKSEGVVVELIASKTTVRSLFHPQRPVFRFQTPDGREHVIRSSFADLPAYNIGQSVPVLYPAGNPEAAIIHSFMELWLAPLVLGIVGTLSFLVGLGFLMDVLRKRRLDTWLSQHGHRIQADIQGIEVNRAIKIQQRSPFQIICTWKDPRTERVHTFKSENFWKEPTELIQGRKTLDVLIKAEDPTEYLVDTHPFPER